MKHISIVEDGNLILKTEYTEEIESRLQDLLSEKQMRVQGE